MTDMMANLRACGYDPHRIDSCGYVIAVPGLTRQLRAAGVLRNKHIPAVYLRASTEQRLALLQGLMDTDGTIDTRQGHSEFTQGGVHRDLAVQVLELVRSLGIKASEVSDEPSHYLDANGNRVPCSGKHRFTFTTDLPVFRLPRKAARVAPSGTLRETQQWNYITDITIGEPVEMRCIKVDHPEHLFLVEGFIPTHNSVSLEGILYGAIVKGCEVYVGDAQKQAADFVFARPFVKGFATTVEQVAVMLKACVAEYERRQSLMGRLGLSKYTELPADLRPPHAIVFLDEFNGLIGADKPRKPQVETPESMAVFNEAMADFIARQDILSAVTQLVTKARAAGFSVLLGAQRLTADMMKALPNASAMKRRWGCGCWSGRPRSGTSRWRSRTPSTPPNWGTRSPRGAPSSNGPRPGRSPCSPGSSPRCRTRSAPSWRRGCALARTPWTCLRWLKRCGRRPPSRSWWPRAPSLRHPAGRDSPFPTTRCSTWATWTWATWTWATWAWT